MINNSNDLPMLLKRKHMLTNVGLSESLYYKLIKENKLPTIRIGNRVYIDRDKLFSLIEDGVLDFRKGTEVIEK